MGGVSLGGLRAAVRNRGIRNDFIIVFYLFIYSQFIIIK